MASKEEKLIKKSKRKEEKRNKKADKTSKISVVAGGHVETYFDGV